MKNAHQPATPISITRGKGNYQETEFYKGLTKREAFAMAAMQGLSANSDGYTPHDWESKIARTSVVIADAFLKELEQG